MAAPAGTDSRSTGRVTQLPVAEEPCCPPLGPTPLSATDAEELAGRFKALADPVRVRLLSLVATAPDGEICACDLPEALDRSQSTVSHHLSQLVSAGLLHREQRGKWAWFRVDHHVLGDLSEALVGADRD